MAKTWVIGELITAEDLNALEQRVDSGNEVAAADITDSSPVGQEILTADTWAAARNAQGIFTGTAALLDEGTNDDLRVWTAQDLTAYVASNGGGGTPSWDDVTDKPDIVVAEDLEPVTARLSAVESTVERIKQANVSYGEGAPSGTAPVGWHYTDVTTGDIYRMEA